MKMSWASVARDTQTGFPLGFLVALMVTVADLEHDSLMALLAIHALWHWQCRAPSFLAGWQLQGGNPLYQLEVCPSRLVGVAHGRLSCWHTLARSAGEKCHSAKGYQVV